MNWTSAKVPLWQLDCQNYWRAGSAFEVRDVISEDDKKFIQTFAESHNLIFCRSGDTVTFEAPKFSQADPSEAPPGEVEGSRPLND